MSDTGDKKRRFEEQVVDFDYLVSLVANEVRENPSTDALIDKFLELKDFKITIDDDPTLDDMPAQEPFQPSFEDELPNEELAQIYYSQGLYTQAKEIYNQLFLLYSEKITYFATQIATLSKLEGESKEGESGGKEV